MSWYHHFVLKLFLLCVFATLLSNLVSIMKLQSYGDGGNNFPHHHYWLVHQHLYGKKLSTSSGSSSTSWKSFHSQLRLPSFLQQRKQQQQQQQQNHHKKTPSSPFQEQDGSTLSKSTVSKLRCEYAYGGPNDDVANQEMVYWSDIPKDTTFQSPFATDELRYLTFEPDLAGWNNKRMGMETAVALAVAMGRIIVLPPQMGNYRHVNEDVGRLDLSDYYHFEAISKEHPSLQIISFETFLREVAMTGQLRNKTTGLVSFPPGNRTNWNSGDYQIPLWPYMRSVAANPQWKPERCMVAFPSQPGKDGERRMLNYFFEMTKDHSTFLDRISYYNGNPTPVDAPPEKRLRETIGDREGLCVYTEKMQKEKVFHLMGDDESGGRPLVHFYLYLFFEGMKNGQRLFIVCLCWCSLMRGSVIQIGNMICGSR